MLVNQIILEKCLAIFFLVKKLHTALQGNRPHPLENGFRHILCRETLEASSDCSPRHPPCAHILLS